MVLMMDIKIMSAFSIIFLSLMVSNEFLEFLANIVYTCILFIVILFFYQNRKHFFNSNNAGESSDNKREEVKIKYITKEITIENDEKSTIITKEQSPGSVRLIQNYSSSTTTTTNNNDNEILIKQLTNRNQELTNQINLQIENSRASELKYFNDSSKFESEIKEQISKIIKLTEKNESLLDSIMILNGSIDVLKSKVQDITKERDCIYTNEQKLLIKLSNFEKKERDLLENEKQLKLKLSESKDQYSQLKKDQDDKIKKIKQLENNIQSLEFQISKILQKQEKEKEKQKQKEMEKSSSDSSLPSSLFSSSPSKSIPIPSSSSTLSLNSNGGSIDNHSSSISPSSSLGKDYSDDSDRGEGSSPSEPKFKSLFNKVKSEFYSSKIVNKAQKGINKHLGSDFFTPVPTTTNNANGSGATATAAVISSSTTSSISGNNNNNSNTSTTSSSITTTTSTTTLISSSSDNISSGNNDINSTSSFSSSSSSSNINNNNEQQLEVIQDNSNKVKESPVKPLIFFDDLGSDVLDSTNKEQIESKITVSPRDQPIQKEQSLSDLFIRGSGNNVNKISLSLLDNLISNDNDNNNNNSNIEEQLRSATPPLQEQQEEEEEQQQLKQLKELQQLETPPQEPFSQQQQEQEQEEIEQILIKSFSIKEEENKLGLRRAKKKPSPGCSTMMEDVSIGIYPFLKNDHNSDIALFGVFDGHAGRAAADSASKLFPKELERLISTQQNYLLDDGGSTNIVQDRTNLIIEAFKNVDESMKDHEYEGCTSTVSLVWKTKNNKRYLQVGNVGDSSAFLCRGDNNQAIELTFDHKANDPSEKQRIKDSGIPISENQTRINGVAVSRSLGNHFIKEQNIGMISVPHVSNCYQLTKKDKFMVIASDGLWDVINGQSAIDKISSLFENGASSSEMASFLIETAVQSSLCKDNVTVIIVKF